MIPRLSIFFSFLIFSEICVAADWSSFAGEFNFKEETKKSAPFSGTRFFVLKDTEEFPIVGFALSNSGKKMIFQGDVYQSLELCKEAMKSKALPTLVGFTGFSQYTERAGSGVFVVSLNAPKENRGHSVCAKWGSMDLSVYTMKQSQLMQRMEKVRNPGDDYWLWTVGSHP
jgi:hypothetical protein